MRSGCSEISFSLPEPQHNKKVGVICYNLGWLPGFSKKIYTPTETNIKSLVDATRLVTVAGLITVVRAGRTIKVI